MCGGFPGGGQYLWVLTCSVISSSLSILPTTLLLTEDGRRSKLSSQQHTSPDPLASVPLQERTPEPPRAGAPASPRPCWPAWSSRDAGSPSERVQVLPLCLGIEGAGRSPRSARVSHGRLCHLEPETPPVCTPTPWCRDQGHFSMVGNHESSCSCESLEFPPRTLAKSFPPLLPYAPQQWA